MRWAIARCISLIGLGQVRDFSGNILVLCSDRKAGGIVMMKQILMKIYCCCNGRVQLRIIASEVAAILRNESKSLNLVIHDPIVYIGV